MKFSVCVAVYNGEAFLARALDSIVAQTFSDYELLILDDGSKDSSTSIAKKYPATLIEQANQGIGAARRHLLSEASGDWIAFLDHDDWWEPTYLEEMAALTSEPTVLAFCDAYIVDEHATRQSFELPPPIGHDGLGHLIPQRVWNVCCVTERRAVLEVGSYPNDLRACEDWFVWFRLAAKGRFSYLDKKLVNVTRRSGSASAASEAYYAAEEQVVTGVIEQFDTLYGNLPADRAQFYLAKLKEKLGLILSLKADRVAQNGDFDGARVLHARAVKLAPKLKGVWYRWLRNRVGATKLS